MFLRQKRIVNEKKRRYEARGPLMVLVANHDAAGPDGQPSFQVRAFVRDTKLVQMELYMLGSVKVNGKKLVVSGTYGADGLAVDIGELPKGTWDLLVPVPDDLIEEWNKGGGQGTAGTEGERMHAWACANEKALRDAGEPPRKRRRR